MALEVHDNYEVMAEDKIGQLEKTNNFS